jgi:AcrR family transcriptional regulator
MTEATRRQLLDAGRRHFARQGLEGARVDRIAEEAQVNKALINYHFRGKLGLYEAVMGEALQELGDALFAALSRIEDPAERLRAWPRTLAELLDEREDLPPLLLGELLRRPDADLPGAALLAESLQAGQAEGSLRTIEPGALLRILLGGLLLDRLGGDRSEAGQTTALLEDLIKGGLTG